MANFIGTDKDDILPGTAVADVILGGKGNDTLDGLAGDDVLDGGDGDDKISGGADNDTLTGGIGNDTLDGGAGNDSLDGGAGNDSLDGGTGADKMAGGLGNDFYVVDNAGDVVTEKSGEGIDTISFGDTTLVPGLISFVENYTYTGTGDWTFTADTGNNVLKGSSGSDTLNGGAGNDTLDGGSGADKLTGGTGNDVYILDNAGDQIVELTGEGVDTVQYGLGSIDLLNDPKFANIENAILTGTGKFDLTGTNADNILIGNSAANVLTGGGGNDVLDGGAGADTLVGGIGDDTYVLDDAGDTFTELTGQGTDTVQYGLASIDLNDAKYANIENATLSGILALNLTGTSGNNVLIGNAAVNTLLGGDGNDILDGGGGADKLDGGAGNDIYIVDNIGDKITDASGTDELRSATISLNLTTMGGGAIENAMLLGTASLGITGSVGNNILTGNDGSNFLDGGTGNDTLVGGKGNDTLVGGAGDDDMKGGVGDDVYVLDSIGDKVTEAANEGTNDEIYSTNRALISLTTNVESYYYAGSENWTFIGSDDSNVLIGGNGVNELHGGKGNDTIYGGAKNDTIYGDDGSDTLRGGDGTDILIGGANADQLYGGAGNDILSGGTGSDYYAIEQIGDKMAEGAEEAGWGTADTILTTLELNLNDTKWDFIENLYLYSSKGLKGFGDENANVILGSVGNDIVEGGAGDDTLYGSQFGYLAVTDPTDGNDKLSGGAGNDIISGGIGNDILDGGADNDTLTGGTGNDSLNGGSGVDKMTGGAGNDTYYVDDAKDTVVEIADGGTDTIISTISYSLAVGSAFVENLTLDGKANIDATGSGLDNIIVGNVGDNVLDGGIGKDSMNGGAGNDTYIVDNVDDKVLETLAGTAGGTDTVKSSVDFDLSKLTNVENLILTGTAINGIGNALANVIIGNASNNTLTGGAGNDTLDGVVGTDKLIGGAGDDTYYVDDLTDIVTEKSGEGNDTVYSGSVDVLNALQNKNIENFTYTGSDDWTFTGDAGNNTLKGGSGSDTLNGGLGNDTLDGGTGSDKLAGGAGDDTYYIDDAGDEVTEAAKGGKDTIYAAVDLNLTAGAFAGQEIESVVIIGPDGRQVTGNELVNTITGGIGNDTLDGGAAIDTLKGGKGDDTYVVDLLTTSTTAKLEDTIVENLGEGEDTLVLRAAGTVLTKAATLVLGTNLENLDASQTGSNLLNLTGNALNNTLTGNDAANILDGGLGNDILKGGKGDDIYNADQFDTVIENSNEGTADTVNMKSSVAGLTFDMGANFQNVENFTLTGLAGTVIGNSLSNTLTGSAGNDTLDGGTGTDKLTGGAGDDTYIIDDVTDEIVELAGKGNDTVQSSDQDALTAMKNKNIENFTYTGSDDWTFTGDAGNNTLKGGSGSDTLDGGLGNDTLDGGTGSDKLAGGAGDDTYYIDDAGDEVTEAAKGGKDTIYAAVDLNLTAGAFAGQEIESVVIIGPDGRQVTGNELVNTITGGIGNDTLDGGAAIDTLKGGKGDDTYVVDLLTTSTTAKLEDTIVENLGEGEDTLVLRSAGTVLTKAATLVLGTNLENLDASQTGSNLLNLTGNALNNTLTGNDAANILDGGLGNDILKGGKGDDIYNADQFDTVIENSNEGTADTVNMKSSVAGLTFDMGANFQNVENFTLTGLAGTVIGNSLSNTLTSSAGNDTLDGGTGTDKLTGGAGDDTYIIDDVTDEIVELAGKGNDTVQSSDQDALTAMKNKNIENFTYTGSDDWTFTGDAGNNTLKGGSGSDTLNGGFGNDTLDGGTGSDKLAGGAGDDTYYIDDAGDEVVDAAKGGKDTIYAGVDYVLGANAEIENIFVSGTTGRTIVGNGFVNAITGGIGNDTLDGGAGIDTLKGGKGDDTYTVDLLTAGNVGKLEDIIVENLGEGVDTLVLRTTGPDLTKATTLVLGANLENLDASLTGLNLLNLTGNTLDNKLTGNNAANILDGGVGNDTLIGGDGNDTLLGGDGNDVLNGGAGNDIMTGGLGSDVYFVDSLFDTVNETTAGDKGGIDLVNSSVNFDLSDDTHGIHSNIENLTLTGAATDGTGNALANIIVGNDLNNHLDGGAGFDTLQGGKGDDTYDVDFVFYGGQGKIEDTVVENVNEGTDTLILHADHDLNLGTAANLVLADNIENLDASDTLSNRINITGNSSNNVLTGNAAGNVIDGGGGNDTLIGGHGQDTLTGGTGIDTFVYKSLADGGVGENITDFTKGAGGDKLDLHDVLSGLTGYDGTNAFSDGFLELHANGDGTTTVRIDADGTAGPGGFTDLVLLKGVVLAETDTQNLIL